MQNKTKEEFKRWIKENYPSLHKKWFENKTKN